MFVIVAFSELANLASGDVGDKDVRRRLSSKRVVPVEAWALEVAADDHGIALSFSGFRAGLCGNKAICLPSGDHGCFSAGGQWMVVPSYLPVPEKADTVSAPADLPHLLDGLRAGPFTACSVKGETSASMQSERRVDVALKGRENHAARADE